ncbi:MAG: hypothetical protein PHE83_19020, partial [Opitutaceae bacterium]|nr:hypothetical protein [Opitutaceae bacterium]
SQPPSLLDKLAVDLRGGLIAKIPLKHKTMIGLLLGPAAWICRAYLPDLYPEHADDLEAACTWLLYAGGALFGIGFTHKALKADPNRIK